MTNPFFPIATTKRNWLWKNELAEVFCISRQTLRKWIILLQTRHQIKDYDPQCRKLKDYQIRQLCELLGYNYSDCLDKMDDPRHVQKINI